MTFTVADGRLAEGGGLPIEPGTRVFLADGEYTTGAFVFDPEGAESAITKLADGVTLGLTDLNAGTSENILRIAQLATLNLACLRAADEAVGLDQLIAGGIEDHLVSQGVDPDDIEFTFTGEYPPYDEIPDETGATFAESRESVEQALAGDNEKTIEMAADCDARRRRRARLGHLDHRRPGRLRRRRLTAGARGGARRSGAPPRSLIAGGPDGGEPPWRSGSTGPVRTRPDPSIRSTVGPWARPVRPRPWP